MTLHARLIISIKKKIKHTNIMAKMMSLIS